MSEVREWYFRWFERHKARNPHNGWRAFEAASGPLLALGYIRAFDNLGATEADADAASERMQRSGEVWPADHMARILAALSPVVAAREADRKMEERRRSSAEWAIRQDERRLAREAFRAMPPARVAARIESIRRRYPTLAGVPAFVEWFAVDEWRGIDLPEPALAWETPAPAGPEPTPAVTGPEPASTEVPLTEGQAAFLKALTQAQREFLAGCSPAKRRQILSPHAARFDRSLLVVAAEELRPGARPEPAAV